MRFPELVDLQKPLIPDSKVIDIGGYTGDYTQEIVKRFDCYVWVFEPNPQYADICRKRFDSNKKIKIIEKAIGTDTLYLNKFSSSLDKNWAKSDKEIKVVRTKWNDLHIIPDLLKINCEGGEYEALEEDFSLVSEILVQFHKIDGYKEKIKKAKEKLSLTHKLIFSKKWDLWQKF